MMGHTRTQSHKEGNPNNLLIGFSMLTLAWSILKFVTLLQLLQIIYLWIRICILICHDVFNWNAKNSCKDFCTARKLPYLANFPWKWWKLKSIPDFLNSVWIFNCAHTLENSGHNYLGEAWKRQNQLYERNDRGGSLIQSPTSPAENK